MSYGARMNKGILTETVGCVVHEVTDNYSSELSFYVTLIWKCIRVSVKFIGLFSNRLGHAILSSLCVH